MNESADHTPSPLKETARVKLAGFGVALLISGLVLLGYQAFSLRASLTASANVQADMIAENVSASVLFDDVRSAQETLHALRKVPYVESAMIYNAAGKVFSGYIRPGVPAREMLEAQPKNAEGANRRFLFDDVYVASSITQNGKTLGSVVVVASTEQIAAELAHFALFILAASLCALWIAFVITSRMSARIAQAEKKLEYLASTDPLTGLPNRRAFYEALNDRLQRGTQSCSRAALILVDLDDFKNVNDTLGHGAGDELLKHVAVALRQSVRLADLVSRIGGDEFAVLVAIAKEKAEGIRTAERIARALARPFDLPRASVVASASVGVSVYPDDAADVAALVSSADIALYAAKSTGKNAAVEFHPSMTVEARRRARLETELRKAIETDALSLAYQPQFDCRTGRLIGVEALARWVHPADGEISPVEFVPVAEDSELIVALGQWVLRRACRDAARWNADSEVPIYVAVNVSARQLRQTQYSENVKAVLAESGLSPHLLELELTESQLMANMTAGVEAMRQLRAAGIRLSLDDFGTGYSSLSYLQSFPVNNLKIDRAFVKPLPQSGQPIVTAIISMAHSFGIAVVAEGVEEPAQLAWLTDAGCDIVQGYLTGKPMPFERITELLRSECEDSEPLA
ncbi:putative bifunctional diguanylate cyclase/phosphodiesterase [Trinickia diaoshuihuensis]|jgi:diguanylate cyclase (GGDEF)-like protein|uniref:putative bifunctional diguanylate cyclase/phosphodiesterase n=1 Tax=Trinickia diaoshuihuensis TaxID=2292265 RepID=UPI000E2355F8|nr:EAL domain-containing protein [Trinickia diaoshuihuensis]